MTIGQGGLLRRFAIAVALAAASTLGGGASALADTNATCFLSAHVNFSNPVTMSESLGYLTSDSSSWSCYGTLDGTAVSSSQPLAARGVFGDDTGPVLGQANPDTCALGVEELTAAGASAMTSNLALNVVMHRTGLLLSAVGEGSIGHDGLAMTGSGVFMPDSGASCLTTGWSSGWIRLMLSVQPGPYPGDLIGSPATTLAHHSKRHHTKARTRRHKHHHHRRA